MEAQSESSDFRTIQKTNTVIATKPLMHILIIEDHESIRRLLGTLLSKHYEVTTKRDGWDAMAWLNRGNKPDLILLDLEMPRLNGFDFLKNIRNSGFFHDIPVVVLSGNEQEKDVDLCFEMGAMDYVKKPFNPLTLRQKIKLALHTRAVIFN